jgi:hypothetical protein
MTKSELFEYLKHNGHGNYTKENYFKKHFPDVYDEVSLWSFLDNFKFNQKLFHFFHDDKDLKLGICKHCGKNRCRFRNMVIGYDDFCSWSCASSSDEKKQKVFQTKLERYGDGNYYNLEKAKQTNINKFGTNFYSQTDECKNRMKQTCQERYGHDYYSQTNEYKNKYIKTSLERYGAENFSKTLDYKEKYRQTCLDRYGEESYSLTSECQEKMKQTCQERYGHDYFTQTDKYKEISYQTKKLNHTFNSSKIERDLSTWLTSNNINFISQYKSDVYPFCCDFYFPEYDLYVEIQGHWTHGGHSFNSENQNDINTLNLWKSKGTGYYDWAINVWTVSDVLKRKTAHENNLNYLEIFSTDLEMVLKILKKNLHK